MALGTLKNCCGYLCYMAKHMTVLIIFPLSLSCKTVTTAKISTK